MKRYLRQSLTKYVETNLRNWVRWDFYGKIKSWFCSILLRYFKKRDFALGYGHAEKDIEAEHLKHAKDFFLL